MSKVGRSLLKGAKEALAYAKGNRKAAKTYKVEVPKKIDVCAIRQRLHMSQDVFASNFGLKKKTVEKWEQSDRKPTDAARAYLTVIDRAPQAVRAALAGTTVPVRGSKKVKHKAKG